MNRENIFVKSVLLLIMLGLISGMASATFLINSEDWKDIYSGTYHSFSQGEEPYFVTDNNLGVFQTMPYGENVNVIQSTETPMASNLGPRLRSQGYQVGNVTEAANMNTELNPGNSDYIIVPEGYPSAALVAAPYARATDSWVLIVNNENLDQVEEIIENSEGENTLIGDFSRDIYNQLEDNTDREITSASKFNLSVKVAEAFYEEENSSRAIISSGDYISRDIMEGESPVLVTGTNYLPNITKRFLFENPNHGIDSAVVTGNRMTNIGMEIRDENKTRNGEVTDEKISVFVKYGQARGDTGVYGISLYPLPTGNLSLSIPSVSYDPASNQLFITYLNEGPSKMYQLTTFRIMDEEEVVRTGGDEEAIFVGAETSRTVSYNVNMSPSEFEEANVEFSTSYGSSPESLDTYLTEEGAFSPPLTKNISFKSINDSSNVTLESVTYLKDLGRFKITLTNPDSTSAYGSVRLTDVMIRGEETSFTSEQVEIPPGESEEVYIVADLDRIDIQENNAVNTVLTYGENSSTLINSDRRRIDLNVQEANNISPVMIFGGVIVLLVVIGVVGLRYVERDLKDFLPSR